jgi:hypothetical protein
MMGVASHTGCNESLNSRHNKVWNSRFCSLRLGGGRSSNLLWWFHNPLRPNSVSGSCLGSLSSS